MARKVKAVIQESHLTTVPRMDCNGFEIVAGEIVKVYGEYGAKFKFIGVTTNKLTGSSWVDCFEVIGGVASVFRSFRQERIKRIPKRGKRAKRVV